MFCFVLFFGKIIIIIKRPRGLIWSSSSPKINKQQAAAGPCPFSLFLPLSFLPSTCSLSSVDFQSSRENRAMEYGGFSLQLQLQLRSNGAILPPPCPSFSGRKCLHFPFPFPANSSYFKVYLFIYLFQTSLLISSLRLYTNVDVLLLNCFSYIYATQQTHPLLSFSLHFSKTTPCKATVRSATSYVQHPLPSFLLLLLFNCFIPLFNIILTHSYFNISVWDPLK